jgi:hypothetical protein
MEWTGLTGLTRFKHRYQSCLRFNPVNLVNPVY